MADAVRRKHVAAKFYIGFRLLGLEDGETLSSCTAAVSPAGLMLTGAVVVDAANSKISQFVEGGVAGTDYAVRFSYKTSLNNEDVLDYLVKVIE